jgi:rubrerythrin
MGKVDTRARGGRARSEDGEAVDEVRVLVEERADEHARPALDLGFVEFASAGAEIAGEFRCADCGYGVVVYRALPHCPMCGGSVWESRGPLEAHFVD